MQRFTFLFILCASMGIARADVVIDFEDLVGNATYNLCGTGQNIGNLYAGQGVAFIGGSAGDAVNAMDSSCRASVNATIFPPNSGDINLFSGDDFATIQFTSSVSSVSLEYVALDPILLTAYDSGGNQLMQSMGGANISQGGPGSDSLISVAANDIAYVTLGNIGLMNEYAFDDLRFMPQQAAAVPEPRWAAPLIVLLALGAWKLRTAGSLS